MRHFFRVSGVLIAALFAQQASAHAHLKSEYTTVNPAGSPYPQALTIEFSEDVEPAFSGIEVTQMDNTPVPQLKAKRDAKQHNRLRVQFKQPLKRGEEYKVNWHVLSVDGHKTKGNYTFSVP
ncbi:copper homeostasis periplasmic binding protein CopC [Erwinia sp. Eh17-17]|jgi:methionine-rich copper-binding protein CopC|uniref:copper homeostasis periplasmic binding protein CopC n=1 Tax=Erwinia sp. Eh17-17 TaxID=3080330 RepID=UPI00320A51BB